MTAAERLSEVRHKMERAKKHILDVEAAIRLFTKSDFVQPEQNPDTGQVDYKVMNVVSAVLDISLITGDAIHNLRSSLDHLAYQLVMANGGTPSQSTGYPICENLERCTTKFLQAKVEGMSNAAIDLIKKTKSYAGGNDEFWIIHRLDIVDKHHLRLDVRCSVENVEIGIVHDSPDQREFVETGTIQSIDAIDFDRIYSLVPLKDGQIVYSHSAESEKNQNVKFGFEVSFTEPEIVKGKRVVETLNELFEFVDGIVEQFFPFL